MKLTIKTLAKAEFTVEMEPERSVKELKEKIEQEQGKDYPVSAQKLIYSGKILADENKLSEYQFDEKKFVVLMITRPPPPPKPAPVAPTTESKSKQTTEDKPKPAATSSTTSTVSSSPSSGTTSATASSQQTTTTTTTESRPQAQSATRAPTLSDVSALSMGEPQVAARLASLMSQPHFRQIQDLIQQSPHLLSSTIESLAATDPEMYNFMSDNPDIFVNALNHPPMAGSRRTNTPQSSMPSAMAAAAAAAAAAVAQAPPGSRGGSQQAVGGPGGRQQPVVDSILRNVSEHDKEAIERLKELGFSEYLAFQAYMACDKDEQLAANLLFQMDQ